MVQCLCSLEVPFAPMVKHLRCTLACQVHLDCGTAPLPCMVQRAPSAVHLCCTYGTRRTIPIKLNRSMAPVPGVVHLWFAALYTSPLQLPRYTHWRERLLDLNVKKNELCQTLSEEASQSDPHSDALYSQSLLLMSHLIPLFTHLKVMHRGR